MGAEYEGGGRALLLCESAVTHCRHIPHSDRIVCQRSHYLHHKCLTDSEIALKAGAIMAAATSGG